MENKKIKHIILNIVYFVIFFIALTPAITGDMMLILEGFSITALLMGVIATPIVIVSIILLILEGYNIKLRYLLPSKRYKSIINESLQKFEGAPDNFIKKYVKIKKSLYRKTGSINENIDNTWVYREKDGLTKAHTLYHTLNDAIKSKGGFYEFCDKITNSEVFESAWDVHSYAYIDIISTELRYLLMEVFYLNEFCVADNGLSDSYTRVNQERIQKLNKIYTPLLFNFKDEIKSLCDTLDKKLKDSNKEN